MKNWIPLSRVEGKASRQAHTDLPTDTYEREMGKEGFYGPSSQLHHRHPPTGWSRVEGPLRPRAFDTTHLTPDQKQRSPMEAALLLSNPRVQVRLWRGERSMDHLVRNGDGDDLLFVHGGSGRLYCDFGHLAFRDGDYIMIPRGTMWRVETEEPLTVLMIEASNDSYRLPDKGIVGQQAVFDPAMLDAPSIDEAFIAQQTESEWQVIVKRRNFLSTITYPFNPLDAVGWHGTLMPLRINWRDIRPLMSHRYHVPPSAHTTFASTRFVVCTFVPRPLESDPSALNVPFFHNNDDYDEVLFYHRGQFFSRDNIHPGMMTLHPCGITHGPHPKALKAAAGRHGGQTDEVAVMIDTRDPLDVSETAESIEWTGYVDSWK
ncbi:MAG: homogentisate 1,2-dioxygenase [Pseudomonadota bacterium]